MIGPVGLPIACPAFLDGRGRALLDTCWANNIYGRTDCYGAPSACCKHPVNDLGLCQIHQREIVGEKAAA